MMKAILTALLLIGFLAPQSVIAQEKMTYEVYLVELAKHKDRENAAKAEIAVLQSEIAELKSQIEATKEAIKAKWAEMLAFVGITQEEYDAFVRGIDQFISKVNGFESQFANDFKAWGLALNSADTEYAGIKSNKIAVFPRLDGKIAEAGRALENSKDARRMAMSAGKGKSGTYTVRLIPERRDCLWRIAEYSDVYGDPFKWPQIYSANQDQIKDPDLIFPGQVLQIP
jgi:nucleoid-associated protein YgaU